MLFDNILFEESVQVAKQGKWKVCIYSKEKNRTNLNYQVQKN